MEIPRDVDQMLTLEDLVVSWGLSWHQAGPAARDPASRVVESKPLSALRPALFMVKWGQCPDCARSRWAW